MDSSNQYHGQLIQKNTRHLLKKSCDQAPRIPDNCPGVLKIPEPEPNPRAAEPISPMEIPTFWLALAPI